ncbi:MAG: hypothetical protein JRD68_00095 [Deltaproteobacteria bacterium]|nr:hypothetical protein [Deltaproteobacteria bacterium]
MNWFEIKTIIRRYLRDPSSNIWDDPLLLNIFNDEQNNIQQMISILEDVKALPIPAYFGSSYTYDWEYPHATDKSYQALIYVQQSNAVISQEWEAEQLWGLYDPNDASGTNYRFMHPWEGFVDGLGGATEAVPFWFPENFNFVRHLSYDDRIVLENITKKVLQSTDRAWRTHGGDPWAYWIPDLLENQFVLFPKPSTVDWDDITSQGEVNFSNGYSYDWEVAAATSAFSGTGYRYTTKDSDNEREAFFSWELDVLDSSLFSARGRVETNPSVTGKPVPNLIQTGDTRFVEDDTEDKRFGTIGNRAGDSFDQPYGLTSQIIPTARNLLLIYSVLPTPLYSVVDQTDWPDFLDKYIIYGTLERAYTANTDGRIQSLSEYWGLRKIAGIEILKRFKQNQTVDRDYRLTFEGAQTRSSRPAQPRLPSNYPVDVSRGSY